MSANEREMSANERESGPPQFVAEVIVFFNSPIFPGSQDILTFVRFSVFE